MIDKIEKVFNKRVPGIIGNFRKSAVMLLIGEDNGEPYIVFEKRAQFLRHQPGDICLPGGKIEDGETPKETAVRETLEELRLKSSDINVIGDMDYFISPYGSIMYPFVAKLNVKDINPSPDEVDHIFRVPLSFFLKKEPLMYPMEIGPHLREDFPYHLVKDGKNYKFSRGVLNQYFYEYEEYVIWGFTAMIVKNFVDIIKKEVML